MLCFGIARIMPPTTAATTSTATIRMIPPPIAPPMGAVPFATVIREALTCCDVVLPCESTKAVEGVATAITYTHPTAPIAQIIIRARAPKFISCTSP
jgi:hypothetical protein